jgi:phosphate transport system substrate-binding protein
MGAPPLRQEPAVPALSGWGRRSTVLWLAVSASMLALLAVAAWVVVSDADQPLPPFLAPGGARATAPARPPHDGLRMAGSGSNLPITRALSTTFSLVEGQHAVVHASVGSGGGVRALLDGVIDIALVSRPLRDGEREQGLVATPYARVPVVVAVHASVPEARITHDQLVEIFDGSRSSWSDGSRIVVLQRERDDSSHTAVDRVVPEFAAANERAYREARWRVLYRDEAMREALADTRGAIGLFGEGVIPSSLPIKALAIDDALPSPQTVQDGSYPFHKDFAFVTRGPPQGQAAAFIAFVLSPAGRRIIEDNGALPLAGALPPAQEGPQP